MQCYAVEFFGFCFFHNNKLLDLLPNPKAAARGSSASTTSRLSFEWPFSWSSGDLPLIAAFRWFAIDCYHSIDVIGNEVAHHVDDDKDDAAVAVATIPSDVVWRLMLDG